MFVAGRESCQNKWVEGLGWQLLFLGEKLVWMAPEDGPKKAAAALMLTPGKPAALCQREAAHSGWS